jgi:mannosyltransferase
MGALWNSPRVGYDAHRPIGGGTGIRRAWASDPMATWLLGAAMLLGLARFWQLGAWSLWLDEALTLADSLHREEIQNPLGYMVLGLFYAVADGRPDEFLLRLPAASLGWLCIPMTYWAVKPVVGRRGAAVAALFIAASAWHLFWSQNARFYTLAQLLGLIGGGLTLRGLFYHRTGGVAAGMVVTLLAAITHPSAGFLFVALLVAPWLARPFGIFPRAWEHPRPWRCLSLVGFLSIFAGMGWVFTVWMVWSDRHSGGSPLHLVLSSGYLVTPLLGAAFLLGAFSTLFRRGSAAVLVVLISVVGLSLALASSFLVRVSAQYIFVLLPWIAAGASIPIVLWTTPSERSGPGRPVAGLALLALILTPSLIESGLYFTVRHGDRPQWREAYHFVFEEQRVGDLILGMEAPVGEYYFDSRNDDLRRWKRIAWLDQWRGSLPDRWARYPRRIWLVVNREQMQDWPSETRARMTRFLDEECRVMRSFDIPMTPRDLDVEVFLRE